MAELYKKVITKNPNNVLQDLKEKNGVQETYMFQSQDFKNKIINSLTLFKGQFIDDDFTASSIGGCTFNECEFVKCKFNFSKLLGVKFNKCIINQCDFSDSIIQDIVFLDNIMSSNKFNNVEIVNNVTINGTDVVDGKQLELLIGDNNSDIITDAVEKKEFDISEILDQIKPLQKKDKSWEIIESNISLSIGEDQTGWRLMIGYVKDGQFDEPILTQDIDTKDGGEDDEEVFESKQEFVDKLYEQILNICQEAKNKVKTDMVKTSIDKIAEQFKNDKPTIEQSIQITNNRLNKLILQNKQLKQQILQLRKYLKERILKK